MPMHSKRDGQPVSSNPADAGFCPPYNFNPCVCSTCRIAKTTYHKLDNNLVCCDCYEKHVAERELDPAPQNINDLMDKDFGEWCNEALLQTLKECGTNMGKIIETAFKAGWWRGWSNGDKVAGVEDVK